MNSERELAGLQSRRRIESERLLTRNAKVAPRPRFCLTNLQLVRVGMTVGLGSARTHHVGVINAHDRTAVRDNCETTSVDTGSEIRLSRESTLDELPLRRARRRVHANASIAYKRLETLAKGRSVVPETRRRRLCRRGRIRELRSVSRSNATRRPAPGFSMSICNSRKSESGVMV
jgi:hypothetical protein